MSKELRVAILGGGRMAQQHATAIRLQAGRTLRGGRRSVPDERRNQVALRRRHRRITTSAERLLAAAKPDVVHIVTPPHTHFDLARLCLTNGASVYVEKPFALTTREAAELIDLAEARKGLQACAAHQVLFQRAGQHYQT